MSSARTTSSTAPRCSTWCISAKPPVEGVFDAMLCLLSARSYTLRFAEDLEDVFPHVPFPAEHNVFARAAQVGARVRAIQTFNPEQPPACVTDPAFVRLSTAPTPETGLTLSDPDGDCLTLCDNRPGRVERLPHALWAHEVSGYPVLRRRLQGRVGQVVDLALFDAFRDFCARIVEHIDPADQADIVLDDSLVATLNRDVLGLPPA